VGGGGVQGEVGCSSCPQVCVRALNSNEGYPIPTVDSTSMLAFDDDVRFEQYLNGRVFLYLLQRTALAHIDSDKAMANTQIEHKLMRTCLACLARLDKITLIETTSTGRYLPAPTRRSYTRQTCFASPTLRFVTGSAG
jgi:hypothetical protein